MVLETVYARVKKVWAMINKFDVMF